MSMLKMIYSLQRFGVNLREVSRKGLVSSPFDWQDHRKWLCVLSSVVYCRTFSLSAAFSCSLSGNIALLVAGHLFFMFSIPGVISVYW